MYLITVSPHGFYIFYASYIDQAFNDPQLSLFSILLCRTTFLLIPILVSLYDKKLNVVRLFGFACKKSEEIEEVVNEMEMQEFIDKRNFDYQSYNIHY